MFTLKQRIYALRGMVFEVQEHIRLAFSGDRLADRDIVSICLSVVQLFKIAKVSSTLVALGCEDDRRLKQSVRANLQAVLMEIKVRLEALFDRDERGRWNLLSFSLATMVDNMRNLPAYHVRMQLLLTQFFLPLSQYPIPHAMPAFSSDWIDCVRHLFANAQGGFVPISDARRQAFTLIKQYIETDTPRHRWACLVQLKMCIQTLEGLSASFDDHVRDQDAEVYAQWQAFNGYLRDHVDVSHFDVAAFPALEPTDVQVSAFWGRFFARYGDASQAAVCGQMDVMRRMLECHQDLVHPIHSPRRWQDGEFRALSDWERHRILCSMVALWADLQPTNAQQALAQVRVSKEGAQRLANYTALVANAVAMVNAMMHMVLGERYFPPISGFLRPAEEFRANRIVGLVTRLVSGGHLSGAFGAPSRFLRLLTSPGILTWRYKQDATEEPKLLRPGLRELTQECVDIIAGFLGPDDVSREDVGHLFNPDARLQDPENPYGHLTVSDAAVKQAGVGVRAAVESREISSEESRVISGYARAACQYLKGVVHQTRDRLVALGRRWLPNPSALPSQRFFSMANINPTARRWLGFSLIVLLVYGASGLLPFFWYVPALMLLFSVGHQIHHWFVKGFATKPCVVENTRSVSLKARLLFASNADGKKHKRFERAQHAVGPLVEHHGQYGGIQDKLRRATNDEEIRESFGVR